MHIGIDFGSSWTKIGYWDKNQQQGLAADIPSLAALDTDQQTLLYGTAAQKDSASIVYPFFKLLLKRNSAYNIAGMSLQEVLNGFFAHLCQEYIPEPAASVTISVPNYFGINARRMLINAARSTMQAPSIHVLPEPVAALLGYNVSAEHSLQGDLLIADMGGGTSDFSLVSVSPANHDIWLETQMQMGNDGFSGREVDLAVLRRLLIPALRQTDAGAFSLEKLMDIRLETNSPLTWLLQQAEQIKIELGCRETTQAICQLTPNISSPSLYINQTQLIMSLQTLFERLQTYIMETLRPQAEALGFYSSGRWNLDGLLLVGGASRTPGLIPLLKRLFPGVKVIVPDDFRYQVVRGLSHWGKFAGERPQVNIIYPFRFYQEVCQNKSISQPLVPLAFDTANLGLDLQGQHLLATVSANSPFNLSSDEGTVHYRLFEVSDETRNPQAGQFMGQELIWDFRAPRSSIPDPLEIYFNTGEYQITAGTNKISEPAALTADGITIDLHESMQRMLGIPFLNPLLKEHLQHMAQKSDDLNLSEQLEATRLRMLVLLQLLKTP